MSLVKVQQQRSNRDSRKKAGVQYYSYAQLLSLGFVLLSTGQQLLFDELVPG